MVTMIVANYAFVWDGETDLIETKTINLNRFV